MTHYIHNINPIVFELGGPLAVRWYGISYLIGFVAAILLLRHWSKKGDFQVPVAEVSNFVVLLAFFGVFIGGRLGYVLLYGFDSFLSDPLYAFKVWEGGMASHGGMIGVFGVLLWTARKHKCSFWNLADGMALVTPIGLLFGRIANFINGELWGRPTQVAWGVIFPQAGDAVPTARHPSQLYEAFGEGLLLLIILWLIRRTAWGRREGAASALFLIIYAAARITVEFFREPDSTVYLGWLTKGQLYSFLMFVVAAAVITGKKLYRSVDAE